MQNSRDALSTMLRQAVEIGLGLNYIDLTLDQFNQCIDGYTQRRETAANDAAYVGHILAAKISQAVWGSKEFPTPIQTIHFSVDPVRDEREQTEKTLQRLRSQYGVKLERR